MSATATAAGVVPVAPGSRELRDLLADIAAGAFARERDERPPVDAIQRIRGARLGALRVPVADGGTGASHRELFTTLIDLAHADANVAHILRAHFWFVELRLLDTDPEVRSRWLDEIVRGAIFGNAASEVGGKRPVGEFVLDTRLARAGHQWRLDGTQWRLDGTKYYSTGSRFSDWVVVYASTDDEPTRTAAAVLPSVGGASATKQSRNLDRHWRNIRTLASHNPTLYKARAIGDHTINEAALPQNGFF
ncbi:MAG: Acyl-CoA dehydrogenase, type 2, C-terminal domain [Solirubrobacterales bacterium]|nr:Acyl-CoA dehydrogenase, type 2, C-terminal domain [Solirubrobacterales bacterium]